MSSHDGAYDGASDYEVPQAENKNFEDVSKCSLANDDTRMYNNDNDNDNDDAIVDIGIGSDYDYNDGLCCPICYEEYAAPISSRMIQYCTDKQRFAEDNQASHITQTTHEQQDDDSRRFNRAMRQHSHPRGKVTIPVCGHEYCRSCIRDHCTYSISIRDLPIRCPNFSGECGSSSQCSVFLPIGIVEDLLKCPTQCNEGGKQNNKDWIKFQRLHRMLEDPLLIPCTRCDELVSSNDIPEGKDDDENRIQCPSCKHVFCRINGDGIYRSSSEAMELNSNPEHRQQLEQSEKAIRELCKHCSHCKIPIWKVDGCNHVVCPVCKNDMCFKCGSHEHLATSQKLTAIRSCKACNGSYFDHRYILRHRLGILAKLPLMLPVYILYVIMTLSLAVATGGCFCCLGCGVRSKKTKKNGMQKDQSNIRPKIVCMPVMAVREVMAWILEPFIDLFTDCQLPCCFCHNAPGHCEGGTTEDENGTMDEDSYEDQSKATEDDIESQTIKR